MRELFRTSVIILLLAFLQLTSLSAQQPSQNTLFQSSRDSLSEEQVRQMMERDMHKQFGDYVESRKLNNQRSRLGDLVTFISKVDVFLKKGLDTVKVRRELKGIEESYRKAAFPQLPDSNRFMSFRELNTAYLLMDELLELLNMQYTLVTNYANELNRMQFTIDSMATDSSIYVLPADSKKFKSVMSVLIETSIKTKPIVKQLNEARTEIIKLHFNIGRLKTEMEMTQHKIETMRGNLVLNIYLRDYPYLWEAAHADQTIRQTSKLAIYRAGQTIRYYVLNNVVTISFLLFFLGSLFYLTKSSTVRIKKFAGTNPLLTENPAFRFPFRSSLLVAISIGQFGFVSAPFLFQAIFWILFVLIMLAYLAELVDFVESRIVFTMSFLILFTIALNLSLFPLQFERWIIVLVSIVSLIFLWNLRKILGSYLLKRRLFTGIIIISFICESISLVAVVFGRFNLSKAFLSSGILIVGTGIVLVLAEFVLNQLFDLYIGSLHSERDHSFKSKLRQFHEGLKSYLIYFIYLGVAIQFYRNFYLYNSTSDAFMILLNQEIILGEFAFSLINIFNFIGIIFVTGWISRAIAFIYEETELSAQSADNWSGLRNWSVVFRLAIIICGGLLAFLVVGIPMDRITIIVGALGVGIGFGLQGIANNILSGIILAIEKPVKIGDQVEVSSRLGKVQSIGIRSTTLQSVDGSEVVIPNSDIINEHLVNWTMSNHKRRVEVNFSVDYSSDLNKVKQVVEELLRKNERIDSYPRPLVLLHSFDESAITFRILLWTTVDFWLEVKSEVILSIHKEFGLSNIKIPFPQLDVHFQKPASESPT